MKNTVLQTFSTEFKAAPRQRRRRSSNENSQKPVVSGEERTDEGAQPSSGNRQELLSAEGESPRGRRRLETGLVRGSVFQGRLQQARAASVRKHVS